MRGTLAPEELRARRRGLRLSQAALGELLGVTPNTVARWERGQQRLATPLLVRLALERLELGARPPAERQHLPVPLSTFIGRRQELRTLRRFLATNRLVTVGGAGGIGKTRLALEVALRVVEHYPDGVWLVDLAPVADPTLLTATVAAALHVPEQPGRGMLDSLTASLAKRRLLLVLDNCEHLATACRDLVGRLLGTCPGVRVVVTSRQVLGVPGEVAWRLAPLSVPRHEDAPTVERVLRSEAGALFLERARAAEPSFRLSPATAAAVGEICRRLDGLPLALELAAARMRVLGPAQLAARLDDRFNVLATSPGAAGRPGHHRTLQAAIGWSHALLSDSERRVFEGLAVFSGGWTLDAAEAVCASEAVAGEDVLGVLERLVDQSLLVVEPSADGQVRYRLLETLRAYAAQALSPTERAEAERRHASFFVGFAETAGPHLVRSDQAVWAARVEQEVPNLRAALAWCLAHPEEGVAMGLRLVSALTHFWQLGTHLEEARAWLDRLMDLAPHDLAGGVQWAWSAGVLAWFAGDLDAAGQSFRAGLRQAEERGETMGVPRLRVCLGAVVGVQNDVPAATALMNEGYLGAREQGDGWAMALAKLHLGHYAVLEGDYERARALLHDAEAPVRDMGDKRHLAYVLMSLGMVEQTAGDFGAALAHYRESLVMTRGLADALGTIWRLEGISAALASSGRAETAARLLGAIQAQRARMSIISEPVPGWTAQSAQARARVQRQLGQRAFVAGLAAGRHLTLDLATAEALGVTPHPAERPKPGGALSPREQEVAYLLAAGLSNREIAEQLTLAESTAQRHVANILAKLGFSSRAQVAAWAVASGID